METKFNSQICTTIEQSERLIALGLKKETADLLYLSIYSSSPCHPEQTTFELDDEGVVPAWSLHRLIEILDTNPFVFYLNCGYDNVIDHVEEYIKSGFIDTRYLEEWCLNEEE